MSWHDDKLRADAFMPACIQILARHVIVEAPADDDKLRNTDLIVMSSGTKRIGCRFRMHEKYLKSYPYDITIRRSRPSQTKTEIHKIVEGWGDLFFYGHVSHDGSMGFARWYIIDLSRFRGWFVGELKNMSPGSIPGEPKSNRDGSSAFCAFDVRKFPRGVVIDSSHDDWRSARAA